MAEPEAPLLVIRGGATDHEVAALVAVLQAMSASSEPEIPRPRRRWGAPTTAVRVPLAPGPGGWRASALPR